jgi:hypothetical protein
MKPLLALTLAGMAAAPAAAPRTSLRGSPASMERQHEVAVERDYTFTRNDAEVRRLAALGKLVPLKGGADYQLARVSHPYARPQVRTLVERLAPAYRQACGEPLVVTSLTRPTAEQPGNAHQLSVHPAGMAVDLRVSRSPKCRRWLEERLLELERKGDVDATREKHPAHYHIAVLTRAVRPAAADEGADRVPGPARAPGVPTEPQAAPEARQTPGAAPATPSVNETALSTLVAALAAGSALLLLVGWCSLRGLRRCPRR